MNYLDVYYSRINHLGETTAERIQNGGIRSFEKWLAESPHTVRELSVERGLYFNGIILTSKDKEYEKIMFLNVANDIPIVVGDIMNWVIEDGSTEKWILIQKEKKVNPTYQTFWIVRCNYLVKWVDGLGHVQQSWSYLVSSLDSKIKGNYRTWNALITPQPNKYLEMLMPRREVDRSTNFIVEQESWSVVEYDHTSVPGVVYISLTEGKINSIYDDVENDLADTNMIADYEVIMPQDKQIFKVGEPINPKFTLTKNGKPCELEVTLLPTDKSIAKIIDGTLTAVSSGATDIIVQLKDYPDIQLTISIEVGEAEQEFSAYIEGVDKIRLDREATYTLVGTEEITEPVKYYFDYLDGEEIATIVSNEGASCVVRANARNKLGKLVLLAVYNHKVYTKDITIIPVW